MVFSATRARTATVLLGIAALASALPQTTHGSVFTKSKPCRLLEDAGFSEQLYYEGDIGYTETITSYYSGASWEYRPQCILKPRSTEEVSLAVETLNGNKVGTCWYVAVRGGGHSNFPASTTDSGVTIDMANLNLVDLNDDESIVSVGAGNRWGKVYSYLEPRGLMVAGGREATVGIAGLLLGGGYSWYSGEVGFAADNVAAYEVVLADGSVVKATATEHADLFKALKGGGPNFGIVTKFELKTFPARDLYGGIVILDYSHRHTLMQTFNDMIIGNSNDDPSDQGFMSLSWNPTQGHNLAFIPANIDGISNSTAQAGLAQLNPYIDMRGTMPVTGIAAQIAGPYGRHQMWHTLTYHSTADMGRKVIESFEILVEDLKASGVEGDVSVIYLFTPFPTLFSSHGIGKNVFGLEQSHTEDSIVFCIQATTPDGSLTELLKEKVAAAGDDIDAYAKASGQDTPWRFMNYAGPHQNPIATYGEENVIFLKEVAAKYDPGEFFQYGVPGGWKLKDV